MALVVASGLLGCKAAPPSSEAAPPASRATPSGASAPFGASALDERTPRGTASLGERPSATKESSADAHRAVVVVPARDDTDALSLVRSERLRAKADGRVLVVLASAGWCAPCRRLKEEIRAGHLDDALGAVTLLAFDADRDGERLASAGYTFEFIPYVALPGPDGRPTASEQARATGPEAWRALVGTMEAWQRAARER